MQEIGEACLKVENAEATIELAFQSLEPHCVSRSRHGFDYTFDFQSAHVYVRSAPGILWIRVEAGEIATYHGAMMLISSEIRAHAKGMPTNMLWVEARDEPFSTIIAHEKSDGTNVY